MNHDKHNHESNTRAHRDNKVPGDGDPLAPNNNTEIEEKKKYMYVGVSVNFYIVIEIVCYMT